MVTSNVFHPSSALAQAIVNLFKFAFVLSAVIMLLVGGLVTYCILRFKGRPDHPDPRPFYGHTKLEIVWTVIPFLLLVCLMVLTVKAMNASDPPDKSKAPDIVVVGHQFWWEARYPRSGVVTANEIHLPAGRPLLFRLESVDVIHDFWVAQLGRKMDMIPGHPNFAWLQADQPAEYRGACSEFCGVQHAWMQIRVVAESAEQFATWEKQQLEPAPTPTTPSAERGARLFQQMTCVNCHAIRGLPGNADARAGPDLSHLASRKTLAAGVIENTPEGLTRWLKNPQHVKPGNLMPNMFLTDAQTEDLVSYLQSLK
ncbi:MAG: cytochrome c oxidase, subunit [Pedosphaera sp.]|nr:cytochrome c oxidase, subunit [Pedosphaera sp.]